MRPTRGWLVNLFLWLCPLAAVAISLAVWWATWTPRSLNRFMNVRQGAAAPSWWFLLPVITIPLMMIVAWRSGRLLGFFAATSLLGTVTLAAVWPRSYWLVDSVACARWLPSRQGHSAELESWELTSARGRLSFKTFQWLTDDADAAPFIAPGLHDGTGTLRFEDSGNLYDPLDALPPWLYRLGFRFAVETTWSPVRSRTPLTLALPFWFLLLLAIPAPLAWTLRARRRRRARLHPSACPHCGYDLRATSDPTGPRLPLCPECGTAPQAE
jgi:hypothetical protein